MTTAMQMSQDRRLDFNGNFNGQSWCWLRVYHRPDSREVVVVFIEPIEPGGNYASEGTSITNAAEKLATLIRQQMGGLEPIKWLHYYPARGSRYDRLPEEFSEVVFERWDGYRYWHPKWRYMSRAAVEELLGAPFMDLPVEIGGVLNHDADKQV